MGKCGNCIYFEPLVNGGNAPAASMSYGLCRWFEYNKVPDMPWWSIVNQSYGSISPITTGCTVFKEKGDDV